ncbi:hypothetical protein M758_4G054900 [Ceratodon purpureus]|nr:hypothetical protein M758_4G054900 [Ceratodon purpureus]
MADSEWDKLTTDYESGLWINTFLQLPFLESKLKRFTEERGGAPWAVLDVGCGMGKHTLMVLKAGASYVLGFDVSKNMVEGAKMATDKFIHSQALAGSPKADFAVASVANCSSIPGARQGTFDLAICVYVMCNLQSGEQVKQAIAEIYKMLKPGGKLLIYEAHVLEYMKWNAKPEDPLTNNIAWGAPKEDGTKWSYFEDEGKPRQVTLRMNSEQEITFTNRVYTLSSWFAWILEAGFQITEFREPRADLESIPADAPEFAKQAAKSLLEMCWECTKPLKSP